MQADIQQWLDHHHTDGVNLSMREMISYKNSTHLINLAPRKTIQAKLAGSYLARTKGRGMEFDEARHYQPGDDIRSIDWRVTARTGKTHTKLYREEKERPVFVLTDLSPSMHFGTQFLYKSVQACHLSALVAWSAIQRGDRIGGIVFNQQQHREFKPFTRSKAVLSLLNGLTQFHRTDSQQAAQVTLSDACARLRRVAHPGAMVFIISDFLSFNDTCLRHLRHISRHCEVVCAIISDPFEHRLPTSSAPQTLNVTDGSRTEKLVLGDRQQQRLYQQNHQQYFESLYMRLSQNRCRVLPISASAPLASQLGGKT